MTLSVVRVIVQISISQIVVPKYVECFLQCSPRRRRLHEMLASCEHDRFLHGRTRTIIDPNTNKVIWDCHKEFTSQKHTK